MPKLKIAVVTAIAATVGFIGGWLIEFSRLMAEHRPDGCDSPCVFSADEYWGDAVSGGLIGAVILGVGVLVLARRRFVKPS